MKLPGGTEKQILKEMEAIVEGLGAMRTDQLHIWELLAQALFSLDELTIFLKEKGIMDDSDAGDLKNKVAERRRLLGTDLQETRLLHFLDEESATSH